MGHFVARPEHYERVLERHGGDLASLAAEIDPNGRDAFIDGGCLCIREGDRPSYYRSAQVSESYLHSLFANYGVADEDLSVLRGRMIVEGLWAPEDVTVEDGRLLIYGDPDLIPDGLS